jgi:anti-sigma regulatory factor (Ser/Thr protein kinase)
MDFSRLSPEKSDAIATDLNAMVHEAIEISTAKLASAKVALELGTPAAVTLRPADCITAIVNLIFNAVDAIKGKGTITIRTGSSDGGSWIDVVDHGPGIPPEIRSRIIEPIHAQRSNNENHIIDVCRSDVLSPQANEIRNDDLESGSRKCLCRRLDVGAVLPRFVHSVNKEKLQSGPGTCVDIGGYVPYLNCRPHHRPAPPIERPSVTKHLGRSGRHRGQVVNGNYRNRKECQNQPTSPSNATKTHEPLPTIRRLRPFFHQATEHGSPLEADRERPTIRLQQSSGSGI